MPQSPGCGSRAGRLLFDMDAAARSGEVQAMRLHEQIPVLVLFENERDGVPDRDLERRDLAARGARPRGGTNAIDRAFEPAYQPLGSSAEAMGLGLRDGTVERCAERREKGGDHGQPDRVYGQV